MELEASNGVVGTIPPCATLKTREPSGVVMIIPDCELAREFIWDKTAHYIRCDVPYRFRKGTDNVQYPDKFNILPEKCRNCKLSKYKACDHKDAVILSSSRGVYELRCKDCGLRISELTKDQVEHKEMFQPVELLKSQQQ